MHRSRSDNQRSADLSKPANLLDINFRALKEVISDVIGWIYSSDTKINYPVVQGDDNAYYLKHLTDGTDWLKEVSGRSDFRANLEISAYDRVITLSTCAYRFENARYVLHGKLVKLR